MTSWEVRQENQVNARMAQVRIGAKTSLADDYMFKALRERSHLRKAQFIELALEQLIWLSEPWPPPIPADRCEP